MNGDNSGVDRRSFLVNAATTAGVAAVAAAGAKAARAAEVKADSAKAAAATVAGGDSATTLKWGVIGTGNRGCYTHCRVLKEAPESQTVALCDIAADRLKRAADEVGHPVQTFSDYQKLIDSADVNAIVIAVPNLLHREVFEAVIKSGKHVLCEKPAGANWSDAAALQAAANGAKQVVMFGMQYRNSAKQRLIYETIQSGKIGKPKYMVQNCSRGDWNLSPNIWRYSDPKVLNGQPVNWRFSHTASGGTLNEFSCHYLDLLHGMVGALPTKVSCDGGILAYKDGRDTWDWASVTMTYPEGITAVHTLSLFGPGRSDVTIMGDEGFIEDRDKLTLVNYGKTANERGKPSRKQQELKPQEPEGHSADRATLALYQDFLQCVKTGKRPDANIDRAVAASRTCWLAELASDRHAEVPWGEQLA
jgi:myo-inositol 2-dehydrogenase / D-chiro-inositol 1-dehydrogenase